ncbi:unnamed protein product [Protopolystoma xenopodis]|uniref:Uncharacterized protein n=1 Tax=Protopolystoma xenopodis TaxID=117903 RepID=A0A448XIU5_9PLAT|nr:unnamed protein product [Protopolystoma xenopodis]
MTRTGKWGCRRIENAGEKETKGPVFWRQGTKAAAETFTSLTWPSCSVVYLKDVSHLSVPFDVHHSSASGVKGHASQSSVFNPVVAPKTGCVVESALIACSGHQSAGRTPRRLPTGPMKGTVLMALGCDQMPRLASESVGIKPSGLFTN